MGRPSEGWKLAPAKPGRRCRSVVFTHAGKRYELGTGEEAEDLAARRAAELYAGVVSGQVKPGQLRSRSKKVEDRPLGPIGEGWINSVLETIDPTTAQSYGAYVDTHFTPFFKTLGQVVPSRVSAYFQHRLKSVTASTVRKERGALIGLLAYATGVDRNQVTLPKVPSRAVGKSHKQGKRSRTELSPDEVLAVIAALPETRARRRSPAELEALGLPRHQWRYSRAALLPVRARYVVAYETSLRPKALDLLSVPEHYTKGATHLTITREIDKARFARRVPLSPAARAALDAICPESGLIFGKFSNRKALRSAARAAGIDEARVKTLHPYDLRSARLTHWAEGGNLPGTAWQAGHKRISTTAIYARGSERSAEDLINAAARPPEAAE